MKKWMILTLIIAVVLTITGLSITIAVQGNFSQKQLNDVANAGSEQVDAYKDEMKKLIDEFKAELEKSNGANKLLSEAYLKIMVELEANGVSLAEMEKEREAMLVLMKKSLIELKEQYALRIENLTVQIAEIDAQILEVTGLPGDNTEHLATLERAKAILLEDKSKYETSIKRIEEQLAELGIEE